MHIDIALEPEYTADEVAELGLLAERYGITTFWITNDPEARDVFLVLARLAEVTEKIRLGIMAISPWEIHPIKLANALLTLNEISNGRAAIIVGGGGAILRHTPFDLTRRVKAVAECVEILKSAAPDEPMNFKGEIFTIRDYRPKWAGPDLPQVLVGANKEQMLRMAAERSDGVVMSDVPLQIVGDAIEKVKHALDAKGRADQPFEFNNYWAWHVKPERAAAVTEARSRLVLRGMLGKYWIEPFLSDSDVETVTTNMASFYRAFEERNGIIGNVPEPLIDTLIENLTFTASTDQLDSRLEVLQQFAAAGLTHLTLGLHEDPADAIEAIGERVMPALGLPKI